MHTKISESLMQIYYERGSSKFHKAIYEWYKNLVIKEWLNIWGESRNTKYNNVLVEHLKWSSKNQIGSTPTILINNKLFPQVYNPKDIESFIEPIMELEKRNIKIMHEKT